MHIYIYINTYIPNYPKPTSWSSSEVLRYKPRQVGGMVRCERSITEHPNPLRGHPIFLKKVYIDLYASLGFLGCESRLWD